ncbi:unnamed protein product [Amoebophrya sp. A120]|nr:unnamed protein product [Amoebophrya sp. A120]|eukprot:GSA120T00010312001.1
MQAPTSGSSPRDGEMPFALGQRVSVNRRLGHVRYIGTPPFAPGIWVGIELDEPVGKNDGSVQGKKYFSCKPKHGVFVKAEQVKAEESAASVASSSSSRAAPSSSAAPVPKSAAVAATSSSSSGSSSASSRVPSGSPRDQQHPAAASSSKASSNNNPPATSAQQAQPASVQSARSAATSSSAAAESSSQSAAGQQHEQQYQALRKKYDDLKRIAQQYKAQNEELKKALKDHASTTAANRTQAQASTENETLAKAELETARLELELKSSEIEELNLKLQEADDAAGMVRLKGRESQSTLSAYEEALQVLKKELEKRDREVEQKESQLNHLTADLADHKQLAQLTLKNEGNEADLQNLQSEMVELLENQLEEKNSVLDQVQLAVNDMQVELEQAYAANEEYRVKVKEMERNLKKHLHVVEAAKEKGMKISLGADLLAAYSRSYAEQLEIFRACLPDQIQTHATPLDVSGYNLIAQVSEFIADFLFDSLPDRFDCAPIWWVQVDLRSIQHSLAIVLKTLFAKLDGGDYGVAAAAGEASGIKTRKLRQDVEQDLSFIANVASDIQELESFSHNLISALEHPEGIIPGSLQTQAGAMAAKFQSLVTKVLAGGESEDEGEEQARVGSSSVSASSTQQNRDRILSAPMFHQLYAFARLSRHIISEEDDDDAAVGAQKSVVLEHFRDLKLLLEEKKLVPASTSSSGGDAEVAQDLLVGKKKISQLQGSTIPVTVSGFAASAQERKKLQKSLTALTSWLRACEEESHQLGTSTTAQKSSISIFEKLEKTVSEALLVVDQLVTGPGPGKITDANSSATTTYNQNQEPESQPVLPRQWVKIATNNLSIALQQMNNLKPDNKKLREELEKSTNENKKLSAQVADLQGKTKELDQQAAKFFVSSEIGDIAKTEVVQLKKQQAVMENDLQILVEESKKLEKKCVKANKEKEKYTKKMEEMENQLNDFRNNQKSSSAKEISALKQLCAKYRRDLYGDRMQRFQSNYLVDLISSSSSADDAAGEGAGGDFVGGGSDASGAQLRTNLQDIGPRQDHLLPNLLQLAKTKLVDLERPQDWIADTISKIDDTATSKDHRERLRGTTERAPSLTICYEKPFASSSVAEDENKTQKLIATIPDIVQLRTELLTLRR